MSRIATDSRGLDLAHRFYSGRMAAERAACPGARDLPKLRGVTPQCQFTLPLENVLAAGGEILTSSQCVFKYGSGIVLDLEECGLRTMVPLLLEHCATPAAAALLANLFICELSCSSQEAPPVQFAPPRKLVELLLNHRPTVQQLPEIKVYATRPVFDEHFNFRGPGWHADVGYLVHGPEVEPAVDPPPTTGGVQQRMPPRLREVLQDFCVWSDVDLVNAIGVFLTGLLVPHFVQMGKPVNLIDGNQPGIGKTLLAIVVGIVLDGVAPEAIHFTSDDEELAKRICANLRGHSTSVLLVDNAKMRAGGEINSPVIEANSMAPQISLRILGQSANFRRPNDLLWFVTMNLTKASGDLVSRSVPIRFHFDGDPKARNFGGRDPLELAGRYRVEILGELAGMIIRWNQLGRPLGQQRHRLARWASVIGGILDANGLPGFLANVDEAAEEFNTGLDELAAIAEMAIQMSLPMIRYTSRPSDVVANECGGTP